MIWVYANLTIIADPANAPSEKLLGLMSANSTFGFFNYRSDDKMLTLQQANPNENVTPAKVKQALGTFASVLTSTNDLWKKGALDP